MKQVYLIGTTHHPCQTGPCQEFAKFVTTLCNKICIKAIAEEMNADALAKEGVEDTIPKQVADRLHLLHRYCDPDESKRAALGIIQNEGIIKVQSSVHNWSPKEEKARVQDEHRKRERVWLNELREIPESPILFICGSNHTSAFADLLNRNGYECVVVSDEWTPNPAIDERTR